jgi:hypothetical protein
LVGLRCLAALSLQGGPDGPTYSGTTPMHLGRAELEWRRAAYVRIWAIAQGGQLHPRSGAVANREDRSAWLLTESESQAEAGVTSAGSPEKRYDDADASRNCSGCRRVNPSPTSCSPDPSLDGGGSPWNHRCHRFARVTPFVFRRARFQTLGGAFGESRAESSSFTHETLRHEPLERHGYREEAIVLLRSLV